MYYLLTLLILFAILFLIIFYCKKKKIIKKICHLSSYDKCCFLNELAEPLGYRYDIRQDIFTSTVDAWQKHFGYGSVYDKAAPYANMIFDCQPVYFDYDGRTWLIEFWKGQYGISTGSELGIYHADSIIPPEHRDTALFTAVSQDEFLDMKTSLSRNGKPIAELSASHWWLTIFSVGLFSKPHELTQNISIRFPNLEMRDAFLDALIQTGYHPDSISTMFTTVLFTFYSSHQTMCLLKKWYCKYVQLKNHLFCLLYAFVTRPFVCTCDRLLYLYYFFPFIFRRMLRIRRFRPARRKYGPM